MMAGRLRETIDIVRARSDRGSIDANGTPRAGWLHLAQVRAQLVTVDRAMAVQAQGQAEALQKLFRIRFRPGIDTGCLVFHGYYSETHVYEIADISEEDRGRALLLHVRRVVNVPADVLSDPSLPLGRLVGSL